MQVKILKKDKRTDKPVRWRLDIKRINHIAYVDGTRKLRRTLRCFGVVLQPRTVVSSISSGGSSPVSRKSSKTVDPVFDRNTDLSLMEFLRVD